MQFLKPFKIAIAQGQLTVSFRHWRAPQAKPGGRYQIRPYGGIEVDAVRAIDASEISDADARAAGFDDREALFDDLTPRQRSGTTLYRVDFRFIGELDDPRASLRETLVDDEAFTVLSKKLARMDTRESPWTTKVLQLIRDHAATRAGDLAPELGWETPRFKTQVRKLKTQGLTESLEVGYRLSARGEDYLARLKDRG